jgi:hypothetical protein
MLSGEADAFNVYLRKASAGGGRSLGEGTAKSMADDADDMGVRMDQSAEDGVEESADTVDEGELAK